LAEPAPLGIDPASWVETVSNAPPPCRCDCVSPDAEDRYEARSPRSEDLLPRYGVAFAVPVAPLRVPENNMTAARIGEHLGADVGSKRTLCGRVAILPAERDAASSENIANYRQQGRRRANQQLATGLIAAGRDHPPRSPPRANCRMDRAEDTLSPCNQPGYAMRSPSGHPSSSM